MKLNPNPTTFRQDFLLNLSKAMLHTQATLGTSINTKHTHMQPNNLLYCCFIGQSKQPDSCELSGDIFTMQRPHFSMNNMTWFRAHDHVHVMKWITQFY